MEENHQGNAEKMKGKWKKIVGNEDTSDLKGHFISFHFFLFFAISVSFLFVPFCFFPPFRFHFFPLTLTNPFSIQCKDAGSQGWCEVNTAGWMQETCPLTCKQCEPRKCDDPDQEDYFVMVCDGGYDEENGVKQF